MIRRKADPRPWRLLPPLAACAALGACHLVIDIGDIELGLPAAGGAGGAAASGGRGGAAGGIGGGAGGSLGGGGAGPACEKPAQCPGTDTTCRKRTCEDGACGVHDAPAATPCQEDGGKICDGQGSCVACTGPEHCESGVCQDHVCLAPTCADKVKNGDETDVDCGGACSPCANGKACATADDCESRLCAPGEGDAGKACAPCAKHEDCAPLGAAYCEAGTCADQKALAGSCAGAAECLSDFCADAVCCDAACEGTCRSCALVSSKGTCTLHEAGKDPDGECGGGVCTGTGACAKGGHLWSQRFGDAASQLAAGVAVGGAAEVVLVGSFESSVHFGGGVQVNAGSRDGYVARFGSDGKHLWSKRFGDAAAQDCRAVAVDAGGNAVVAGDFAGSVDFGGGTLLAKSSRDLFVAKLDPAGKHLWSKRFGASGEHAALAVASDPKGAVLVTGWVKGAIDFGGGPQDTLGHQSLFALKLGPDGSHIWSAIYGGDAAEARGLAVDGSGNAVLAGRFEGSADFGGGQLASKGGADIFVAKLDASGKHLFSQRFGESDVQEANAVAVGPSGSIVVAGAFQGKLALGGKTLNSGGSADVLVAALAPDGKVIWGNGYGGPSDQIARAVTLDSQGLVLVAGELQGKIDFGGGDLVSAGQNDAFLAKLGPDGKHLWSKRFGFGAAERANAVAVDGSGHPVLAGIFAGTIDFGGGLLSSMGGDDIFLARFDP